MSLHEWYGDCDALESDDMCSACIDAMGEYCEMPTIASVPKHLPLPLSDRIYYAQKAEPF